MIDLLLGVILVVLGKALREWMKVTAMTSADTIRKATWLSLRTAHIQVASFALHSCGLAKMYLAVNRGVWVVLFLEEAVTHATKLGVRWYLTKADIGPGAVIAVLLNILGVIVAGVWE